ncbi:hypothetical protein GS982_20335 [Rhodococcus hoagii]|nr:hypothetical protein [Prescottella equi]NKZ84543.1 hypothetical protein [Prescottella equi]
MRTLDWRRVWRWKDKLPRGSHYKTAVLMNRRLAEQMLELPESTEPPTPLEYTLDTYLLMTIVDCLQGVQAAVIAGAGADPPEVKPMERPVTAADLVKDERWRGRMNDLVNLFADDVYRDTFAV